MGRLEVFNSYKDHPWFSRVYKRLKSDDIALVQAFIKANDHLGRLDFEYAVNRMFLDKDRPKRYKEILELLTCANSAT